MVGGVMRRRHIILYMPVRPLLFAARGYPPRMAQLPKVICITVRRFFRDKIKKMKKK